MANTTSASIGAEISTGFRSLFYLIPPQESTFERIEDVPPYVDKATPYFLSCMLIEFCIQILSGKKDRCLRFNDAFSSLCAGIVSQLPLMVLRNIETCAYIYVYENYRLYELPWDSWLTWLLCMLATDFGYYWVHRMAHEINFMWAGHQVHHSAEDYNLTTALRQSALQRYSSWIFYLPMALFIPPSQFLVHIQFNLLYQYWIHINVVGKLGPLEYIMNTASHHRVHHGRNRYCIDKNYAGVFIIWDRLFGTFVEEKEDEPIAYGLVHPINSWDVTYIQLCHWQYMFKTAWNTKGFGDKLSVFFKGPGWEPGKPRLGQIDDIPDIRGPQPKYSKDLSGWMTGYAWFHFIVAIVLFDLTNQNKAELGPSLVLCSIFAIFWTLTNIGLFYEHSLLAPVSELIRCLVFIAFDIYFCEDSSSTYHIVGRFIFMLSAIVCLYQCTVRKQKIQ